MQYPEDQIRYLGDLRAIPLRGSHFTMPARLDAVSTATDALSPTEADHYQLRRTIDIFARPSGEALGAVAVAL